jgi:hypothetical protein
MVQIYVLLPCRLAGGWQLSANMSELCAIIRYWLVHEKIFTSQVLLSAAGRHGRQAVRRERRFAT